jgi:hypothetical protein
MNVVRETTYAEVKLHAARKLVYRSGWSTSPYLAVIDSDGHTVVHSEAINQHYMRQFCRDVLEALRPQKVEVK